MAIEKAEAIVLKTFNWSESSRTVVLFTNRFGKLALVDKGGRRVNSKRGRLIPFARLEISFYSSEKESRGYLSEVALLEEYQLDSEGALGRLAYASGACELLYLLTAEEEPDGNLFSYFTRYLSILQSAARSALPAVFIAFFQRLLSNLGYHQSLSHCTNCGRVAEEVAGNGSIGFCAERGGIVCKSCEKPTDSYIRLSAESFALLFDLQNASLSEAAQVKMSFATSMSLIELLAQCVYNQAGVSSELKSLEFLTKLKNSETTE